MSELPRRRKKPTPQQIETLEETWQERWLNEGGEQHVPRPTMQKSGHGPRASRLEEERRAAAANPRTRQIT